MPVFRWSQTANNNGTADPTISWPEGMAPSQINDSARAEMAAVAMYRDDISGAIVTAGSSTAYTVASNSSYDSLAHLNAQMIAFTPHATNGAGPVTLNVDGQGAKALRSSPNTELLAGVLIQGTPYVCTYSNSDGAFYLQSFFGNPYNVPLGAGMDYWLPTAPNSSFVFPIGQAISRTTYATLFAAMGTTYGTGDGSTTFNLPDKTGRVSAMLEGTATRLTSAGGGVNGAALGSAGGTQTKTLLQSDFPNVSVAGVVTDPGHAHSSNAAINGGGSGTPGPFTQPLNGEGSATINSNTTGISVTTHINGNVTQTLVNGLPPIIVTNYIIRII